MRFAVICGCCLINSGIIALLEWTDLTLRPNSILKSSAALVEVGGYGGLGRCSSQTGGSSVPLTAQLAPLLGSALAGEKQGRCVCRAGLGCFRQKPRRWQSSLPCFHSQRGMDLSCPDLDTDVLPEAPKTCCITYYTAGVSEFSTLGLSD